MPKYATKPPDLNKKDNENDYEGKKDDADNGESNKEVATTKEASNVLKVADRDRHLSLVAKAPGS